MHVNVVIVAAGKGTRLQSELPKPFLSVAGRPILVHTLRRFEPIEVVRRIVVVVAAEREALCRESCSIRTDRGHSRLPLSMGERNGRIRSGMV